MIRDKIVFITGASSGIGQACAKQFAAHGAQLVLCARRLDLLDQLAASLTAQYPVSVHTLQLDVRNADDVAHQLTQLSEKWRHIDILINNAGLAAGLDPIQTADIQDWEMMIDTNVKGLLYVTRAVLPQMTARNTGHIINIGSVAGHSVYPKGAVYCATKHAVNALTQGLRMDLNGTEIRVSTVDPGAVETNFSLVRFKGDVKRAASVYEGMQALMPEDVAETVLFCATRPAHVNISEIIMMPTAQASATMVARKL